MTIVITFDCMIRVVSSSPSSRNKGVGAIPTCSLVPSPSRTVHRHSTGIQRSSVPLETKGLSVLKTIILRVLDRKISCLGSPLR